MEVKNRLYARISVYAERVKAKFLPDIPPLARAGGRRLAVRDAE